MSIRKPPKRALRAPRSAGPLTIHQSVNPDGLLEKLYMRGTLLLARIPVAAQVTFHPASNFRGQLTDDGQMLEALA